MLQTQTKHSVNLKTEQDQIKRAKRNPASFEPLYDAHYHKIFGFVYNRVASKEQAAEIVSDVFYKAMTKIQDYTFKGVPFSSWLFQIARNEVNMYYRQSKKNRTVSIRDEDVGAFAEEVDLPKTDLTKKLVAVLNALSVDEIELIELKYFEKKSHKEIAEILGISEANSKVRIHRIIEKLKKTDHGK